MTLQCKFPPDYVLDKMEWYEVTAIMKYQYYTYKDGWEQARLVAYMVAQVNSKKTLTMSDILQFPWEKEEDTVKPKTSISKEEIAQLKAEAQKYMKTQNKTIEKRETANG